jgi:two-component system, NtrC family, response regulator AtoC
LTPSEYVTGNGRHFVSLREVEDNYIEQVLAATGHNKTQACRILGIHPTSLLRRMKREKVAE